MAPCAMRSSTGIRMLLLMLTATVSHTLALDTHVIHVAPHGNDQQGGTKDAPIAHVSRAMEQLARWHEEGKAGEYRVVLHNGVHYLSEPLAIGPEHLPTDGGRLVFAAAADADADEKPILSGGRRLDGWQISADGTWTVSLPEEIIRGGQIRELFVQGARRPRARHPNAGYFRIDRALPDRRSGFYAQAGDLPRSLDGGELVFLHDWSISRIEIASVNHATNCLRVAYPIGNRAPHYAIDHFEKNPRYFVENHRSLLDSPGEWFCDPQLGQLTYWPLPDESPEHVEVIVPDLSSLVIVQGREAQAVRNVHFRGISFQHCRWSTPEQGYASGQSTVHERRDGSAQQHQRKMMEAAILFEQAEDCSLLECHVSNIGQSGIWFGSQTHRCRLQNSVIEEISGNGVNLGEDTSRRVGQDVWWQASPEQAASHHVIADNMIRRCGRQFFGAVGVWVGLAHHVRIVHNEITELPYTGVSLGWMWNPTPTPAGQHLVARNHIHHVMQILSDGGGIYTLGRQPGTRLSENHIHDVPLNAGRAESNGMFLDEGTDQITIDENLIHGITRSPLRFHRAEQVLVRGNVLVVPDRDVPPVRFNNTPEKNVRQEQNEVLTAEQFDLDRFDSRWDHVGRRE